LEGIVKNPAYSPTNYGTTHSGETFAENFAIYFINPQALKNWNEEVYEKLDQSIDDRWKNTIKGAIYKAKVFKNGGEVKTEYQKRNVGGSDVYYKRENNGKWCFISKEEFYLNANDSNTILFNSNSEMDNKDTITMDVPLFIRMLELAREDIKSDEQLHHVVENVLDLKDKSLTMDDYDYIVEGQNFARGGSLESILEKRPYARMYYVIWNDYIGNLELGYSRIEMIGQNSSSISDGAFENMSDVFISFFDYLKSEDAIYFAEKHPKSKFSIESRFYDGVSEDDYGVVITEKVLFKVSASEVLDLYHAKKLKRGGQTQAQQDKIAKVMGEFKRGELKTSYGEKVTDDKQAIAIALSEAGISKKEEGGIIEGQLHSECNADDGCGVKFEVGDGGSMIEAERDEAVIVSKAFDDNSKYTIKGEPSEIASALNVLGGGKNFDSGAVIETPEGKTVKTEEIKKEAKDTDVERKLESGSVIINRRSMADNKEYEVTGTPRQIASAINSINGNGVVIEDGAIIK
jgi:hypothetical protein